MKLLAYTAFEEGVLTDALNDFAEGSERAFRDDGDPEVAQVGDCARQLVARVESDEQNGSLEATVLSLIGVVESTGGLVTLDDGRLAPAADPDWTDLADAYTQACRATGHAPMIDTEEVQP